MAKLYFSVEADYQKVIRLREEIAKLEKQLKGFNSHTTTEAIENLQNELKDLRSEYNNLTRSAAKSGAEIEKSSLSMGKALAAVGGVAALKSLGSEIIRVRGEFQEMETAIETLVGKSMSDKLLPQIKELAKVSPLTMTDIVGAEKMMLGFNIEADKTIGFLKALSDVSMGSSQKFNSLTLAFSQMSAAGKLMGQDLNQMINAGFNPLQQISQTTGKSIATLKEEMSKGAVSAEMVQKAFIDATSAGGKFYKMSENASKTINGQISMMEDAWDAAFNEMGQNFEGVIMSGIQATTSLIQNYETVGKILVSLVATYGVYKAALIANIALEKVQAVQRLASIKGISTMSALTGVLTKKITLLNAVMSANPYVLLATAVTGVVAAMWAFHDSSTEAEKAQSRLAKKREEEADALAEHGRKIDSLIEKSRDLALTDLQRGESLADLRKEYPKIFEQYDIETIKLADILDLKRQIAEEDAKRAGEKEKKDFADLNVQINALEFISKTRKLTSQEKANLERLRADRDAILQERGKGFSEQFISSLKDTDIKKFDDYVKDLESKIKGKGENGKIKMRLPIDIKGTLSEEALYDVKSVKSLIDTIKTTKESRIEADKNKTTWQQDLKAAREAWELAKKELKSVKKNKDSTSKEYEDAVKKEKSAKAAYEKLGGKTDKQLKQEETEEQKKKDKEQKIADELLSIRRKNQQDEINLMQEGSEKRLKQIELDYQKELDEIEKQKRELRDKQGGKLTDEQHAEFGLAIVNAEDKKNKSTSEVFDDEEKAMNDYLKQYGSWMQKREAITKEYTKRINDAATEGEKLTLGKQMEKELAEVDNAAKETTSAIVTLFEDMSDKTIAQMREIADEAETILAYLKSGKWVEVKDKEGKGTGQDAYGFTEAQFNTIKDDPEKLKSIANGFKGLRKEADEAEPTLKKMGDAFDKLFSDDKNFEKNLSVIIGGIGQINQAAEFLGSTLSQISDAMGGNFLGGIAEGIGVATEAVNGAMKGAEAGKVFGPWGAAAGAAIGLVGSLTSSLSKLHDKKHEKRIVRLQEQIETLEKTYDKLGEEIESAYSNDAKGLIEDQNKLLEQQKVLIQQQIKEEEDKKKTDKNRIKEWQEQLEEIDKTIEDNKEAAKDAIFGSDLQSAIEDFASAYADAWSAGEDKAKSAKDMVKTMIKNMIMESIKAAASDPMKAIREKLLSFWSDEYISGWEQDYINKMATDLQEQLDRQFGWADGIMGKDAYSQEASSKGFQAMSQDTGDELNGRFTALQISGEETKNQVTLLNITASEIKAIQMGVRDIATGIQDQLANSYLELVAINENTGATAKYLKDIKADIAEVKENTKNL